MWVKELVWLWKLSLETKRIGAEEQKEIISFVYEGLIESHH